MHISSDHDVTWVSSYMEKCTTYSFLTVVQERELYNCEAKS